MKKILFLLIGVCLIVLNLQSVSRAEIVSKVKITSNSQFPSSWTKCGQDIDCAQRVSGVVIPVKEDNFKLRAKKNLVEIKYPFDKNRDVYIRKSSVKSNGGDISGVADNFPVIKQLKFKNGTNAFTRGYSNKFFIILFSISQHYYSIYCKQGLRKKEVESIYEQILSAI